MSAKRFEYVVSVEKDGTARAEGRSPAAHDLMWSPEHLLLESLVRCSFQSLRFHADRVGVSVDGIGTASARVVRPVGEPRMRIVDVTCRLAVTLDSLVDASTVEQLLADAEHDCFVGATLKPKTTYEWLVNDEPRQPAGIPSGLREPRLSEKDAATSSSRGAPNTLGLVCDRCASPAPRGDLAEWEAWNRFDMSPDQLADDIAVHVLICPDCRRDEQSPAELGGGA